MKKDRIKKVLSFFTTLVIVFCAFAVYGCDGNGTDAPEAMSEKRWKEILDIENFDNVTMCKSIIGACNPYGIHRSEYYRMSDGELYTYEGKLKGDGVKDNLILSMVQQLADGYSDYTYDAKKDVYFCKLGGIGDKKEYVYFTDEGLSAIMYVETVYDVSSGKTVEKETIYEFFDYGASLSEPSECEHNWQYWEGKSYCLNCQSDGDEYEAALLAELDFEGAVIYKASEDMLDTSYPKNKADLYLVGRHWFLRNNDGGYFLIAMKDCGQYFVFNGTCVVFDAENKTYSVYKPNYSPMDVYDDADGIGVFEFYAEGVVAVSRDGVRYTVEYHYYPDGRAYFSHSGGVHEFDTNGSSFVLRDYKK